MEVELIVASTLSDPLVAEKIVAGCIHSTLIVFCSCDDDVTEYGAEKGERNLAYNKTRFTIKHHKTRLCIGIWIDVLFDYNTLSHFGINTKEH